MRGALPKPEILKIAEGTIRRDRKRKRPAKSDGVTPRCPFAVNSIAGRKWKEIVEGLKRLGLIDRIDATHIEGLCYQYQLAKEADKIVAKEGFVTTGALGSPIKHPAAAISDAAWAKVRAYCNDLGLNHLSRQRMESTKTEEATSIEEKYLA